MRKRFGVLFQDGALFGSMNLYDNVAFPLRQHTDKGEEEIAEIVNRRLAEVGLGDADDKMPNELSGGMRKRAGLRARARARPRHRAVRRARLRPGPGAHGAAVRADPGDPRGERRRLRRHHPRHHERAPRRRAHLGAVEGPDRRVGPGRASCSTPRTRSCASSCRGSPRARSAWSEHSTGAGRPPRHDRSRHRPRRAGRRRRRGGRRPAAQRRHAHRTSCASRTRASWSRATTSRSAAARSARSTTSGSPTTTRPRSTIASTAPYAPLHEGTTATDPPDRAVGRRQPLHRARRRRPTTRPGARRRRPLGGGADDLARRPRPAVRHARPETRKGLQRGHPGSATQYEGQGQEANAAARVLQPGAVDDRARWSTRSPATSRRSATSSSTGAEVTRRWPSARGDMTTSSPTPTPPPGPIAAENASRCRRTSASCPARCARATRRSSTCAPRSTTSTRWSPASKPATKRLAPFFRQLRPLRARRDARRSPTCARSSPAPAPATTSPTLLRQAPRWQRDATPAFRDGITALRKSPPVLDFIRPYTPDLVGWFLRDFGQGAANYDANGHYARIEPIFTRISVHRQPGRRPARRPSPAAQRCPAPRRPTSRALPRRRQPAGGRRLGTRGATRTASSTATRRRCCPGHESAPLAIVAALAAAGRRRRARRRHGRSGGEAHYKVRAIFDARASR